MRSSLAALFVAVCLALAPLSLVCSGGGSGSQPTRFNPCADEPGCYAETIGTDLVVSRSTGQGYTTSITNEGGEVYEVIWEVSDQSLVFTLRLPDGTTRGPVRLEPVSTDPEGTAAAAYYLYANVVDAELPVGLRDYTGPNPSGSGNHAGCDWPASASCAERGFFRSKGACCDVHDECITMNCGGNNGTGHVGYWLALCQNPLVVIPGLCPASADCAACHNSVIGCFLNPFYRPGKSRCCDPEHYTCDKPQQCMINGEVVTDPCKCLDGGIDQTPDQCHRCTDEDGDGYSPMGGIDCPSHPERDCDDTEPSVHPDAPEICDGKDNDCDRAIDEGCECGGGQDIGSAMKDMCLNYIRCGVGPSGLGLAECVAGAEGSYACAVDCGCQAETEAIINCLKCLTCEELQNYHAHEPNPCQQISRTQQDCMDANCSDWTPPSCDRR